MDITADQLVDVYIKMRDKKDTIKRDMEAQMADIEAQMQLIGQQLLDLCKDTGAESIRTAHGTAYRTIKQRFWTNDWEAMHKFIREHEAMELLERRIHQTNMKQFLEEHPELRPAGLNIDREYAITIRRK
jgi:arsenate reductase-like glutaredoxin family protein